MACTHTHIYTLSQYKATKIGIQTHSPPHHIVHVRRQDTNNANELNLIIYAQLGGAFAKAAKTANASIDI